MEVKLSAKSRGATSACEQTQLHVLRQLSFLRGGRGVNCAARFRGHNWLILFDVSGSSLVFSDSTACHSTQRHLLDASGGVRSPPTSPRRAPGGASNSSSPDLDLDDVERSPVTARTASSRGAEVDATSEEPSTGVRDDGGQVGLGGLERDGFWYDEVNINHPGVCERVSWRP